MVANGFNGANENTFSSVVQSSLKKQNKNRLALLDSLSPWKDVHAEHPETSTTYVSNTMTQEENVFMRGPTTHPCLHDIGLLSSQRRSFKTL